VKHYRAGIDDHYEILCLITQTKALALRLPLAALVQTDVPAVGARRQAGVVRYGQVHDVIDKDGIA
jgi:hypothetical protein